MQQSVEKMYLPVESISNRTASKGKITEIVVQKGSFKDIESGDKLYDGGVYYPVVETVPYSDGVVVRISTENGALKCELGKMFFLFKNNPKKFLVNVPDGI